MKILIHVTKEILERSAMCGRFGQPPRLQMTGSTCAFAVAMQEIFPLAHVGYHGWWPNGVNTYPECSITRGMATFIRAFDHATPDERRAMAPQSFELEVPQEVIEKIGLGEVYRILSESKTLELVKP
jgi:hypothetical protein